jgi:hypothetical protein
MSVRVSRLLCLGAALVFIIGFAGRADAQVSNQVSVTQTGFAVNHVTQAWAATMTVTNTSSTSISGPIEVVLTNLTAGVAMRNNTGAQNGSPYITVTSASLAPGESSKVMIEFSNTKNASISFTPVTYSGSL